MVEVLVGGKSRQEVLKGHLERLAQEQQYEAISERVGDERFSIQNYGKIGWLISGVIFRAKIYEVLLANDIMRYPHGQPISFNQEDWYKIDEGRATKSTLEDRLMVACAPFYMTVFETLDTHREHTDQRVQEKVNHVRNTIGSILNVYPLMTTTRVTYHPEELDSVSHYFTPAPFDVRERIRAMPGHLEKIATKKPLCHAFFVNKADDVDNVFFRLTNRTVYINGTPSAPPHAISSRALTFGGPDEADFVFSTQHAPDSLTKFYAIGINWREIGTVEGGAL